MGSVSKLNQVCCDFKAVDKREYLVMIRDHFC